MVSPELQKTSVACAVAALADSTVVARIRLRGLYLSTKPLRLPESLLRCQCTGSSGALHGLSMATGEGHEVLDTLPFFQQRVCVGSALMSRPARLSHTHAPGLGAPGIS